MLRPQTLTKYHFTIFALPPVVRTNMKVVNLSLSNATPKGHQLILFLKKGVNNSQIKSYSEV